MIPADLSASGTDLGTGLYMWLTNRQDGYLWTSASAIGYLNMYDGSAPFGTYALLSSDPYASIVKSAYTQLNDWYNAGYINKDVLSNQNTSQTLFDQGKSGIGYANTTNVQSSLVAAESKGWDPQLILCTDKNGKYPNESFINNGTAVSINSKNPERTMMALDLLCGDASYATLAYYGIEGTDYVLDSQGQADYPSGVTADNSPYAVDASAFWFVDKALMPPRAGVPKVYTDLKSSFSNILFDSPVAAYTFDPTSVKSQVANLNTVQTQYGYPLMFGAVTDVNSAWDTYVQKLDAAGVSQVMAADQQQLDAYLKANTGSGN